MRRKSEHEGVKSRLAVCLTAAHTNPQGREEWRESDTERVREKGGEFIWPSTWIKTTTDLRGHLEALYISDDEDVTVRHDADGWRSTQSEYP